MSEKARGAIFNALGDITGLSVLDAFAGSGALGIEAISRGARSAVAVDHDRSAVKTIHENIERLHIEDTMRVIKQNVGTWCSNHQEDKFDIIFADPPYDAINPIHIRKLTNCLAPNGVLVLSWPGSEELLTLSNVVLLNQRSFGDIQLAFYRKSQ